MVAYFQKMREIRDEFTEQGLFEFEQSVTSPEPQGRPQRPHTILMLSSLIAYNIDKAICDKNDEQPKRKYLGGSSLGSACSRQVQYRYMQTKSLMRTKSSQRRTLRIFDMGHFIEDYDCWLFKGRWFELKTHDSQGKQFGFAVADEQIKGHIDGVICSGPVPMSYPFLWECKSANSKKFSEFVRKGVADANPVYAAQLHCIRHIWT